MPEVLPAPVGRWVEAAGFDRLAGIETIGSIATGRIRIGPLPWLPVDVRTVHHLGRGQVRDIRLRIGPVPVLRVLDAYVDGAGITKIGPVPSVGPAIDQGAFLAMWAEAVAWPAAWRQAPGLRWEAVDDDRARLHIPFGDGTEVMDVAFDPASAYPYAFDVVRFRSKDEKLGWRAECSDLRSFGEIRAWSHVTATWADAPGPWFEAWFRRIVPNVPVEPAMARARRAIEKARG